MLHSQTLRARTFEVAIVASMIALSLSDKEGPQASCLLIDEVSSTADRPCDDSQSHSNYLFSTAVSLYNILSRARQCGRS
jgi:hypothetical protein